MTVIELVGAENDGKFTSRLKAFVGNAWRRAIPFATQQLEDSVFLKWLGRTPILSIGKSVPELQTHPICVSRHIPKDL